MSIFRDFRSASRGNAAPVTTVLVVLIVVGFLVCWVDQSGTAVSQLRFWTGDVFRRPWGLVSYPFAFLVPNDLWSAIFAPIWLWSVGGMVERELGSAKYLITWVLFSALCAVFVWIGMYLVGGGRGNSGQIIGPWPAVVAITVIWGTRTPDSTTIFMFVIPIAAKWLAWLSVALVFFVITPVQVAPFGAIPYILAYFFAKNQIPFAPYSRSELKFTRPKKWERYDKSYYKEVQRREQERAEKERLRKLFEGSLKDDDEK